MEASNSAAAWISLAVTMIGLGGLIEQASAINDKMDPFHATRTAEYLGVWFQRQQRFPWWKIAKPPPLGPVIAANMADGFCGTQVLYITRIPTTPPGKAGWSLLLSMCHTENPAPPVPITATAAAAAAPSDHDMAEKGVAVTAAADARSKTPADHGFGDWDFLETQSLIRHKSDACVVISRTTLIAILILTNARPVFQFSDAPGFRAGYASYCGQWYLTWPIGEEAVVRFARHDSLGSTEVLPRSFVQRADRCGQMVCGVVYAPASGLNVAFPGRKAPGAWVLEHSPKGFQGAHGGRHLYNMLGGKAYEVDYLFARPVLDGEEEKDPEDQGRLVLTLPSREKHEVVRLSIPAAEEAVIRHALDCLPWNSLSWSVHRGMRDLLVAFAKPVMDAHRAQLAELLQRAAAERAPQLRARGWDPAFVRDNMGLMAASAVLAGEGNSGDSVRVVTDIVAVLSGDSDSGLGPDFARLDEVNFWRRDEIVFDTEAIIALTKVFILEWSNEFDYQVYHHLPMNFRFG